MIRRFLFALLIATLLLPYPGLAAQAAPCAALYVVSNLADSGPGSLRQGTLDVCVGGTITFYPALNGQTITTASEILIDKDLTISGPGSISISGGNTHRIFKISVATVTISGLDLTYGNSVGATWPSTGGGAIWFDGTLTIDQINFLSNTSDTGGAIEVAGNGSLTVTNSSFSNNDATGTSYGGGAIHAAGGSLTISKSVFSANSANGNGGGAIATTIDAGAPVISVSESAFSNNSATAYDGGAIYSNGPLTVTKSTFNGNFAQQDGGAINLLNGQGTFTNLTISGNSANNNGGGINYRDDVGATFNNVTITLNRADADNNGKGDGGGYYHLRVGDIPAKFGNSILAGNLGPASSPDCFDTIDSLGYNLIGSMTGCTLTGVLTGNQLGISPALVALANNGGLTETHALTVSSPAIDAGDPASSCESADQRGMARFDGNHDGSTRCDMGAFEYVSTPAVASTSLVSAYSLNGPANFTVTFSEDVYNPAGNSAADDVTNPANYLLVEAGANAAFETASCSGGLAGDDVHKTVTAVSYPAAVFTSQVTLAGALPVGKYRLLVCGTTSIANSAGVKLNNGADHQLDFNVQSAATAPVVTSTTSLPATGFAVGRLTHLPEQPLEQRYASYGDLWLEISSLQVKTPIVGVRNTASGWDVSWLGNSVGWLEGSAFPTWAGNTVLTGHVWNADNTPGIFANIKDLKYGQQFKIHAFGQVYTYEVRENAWLWGWSSAKTIFKHEEYDWVTLLTCEGYNPISGGYFLRRMIRAVLIGVQ